MPGILIYKVSYFIASFFRFVAKQVNLHLQRSNHDRVTHFVFAPETVNECIKFICEMVGLLFIGHAISRSVTAMRTHRSGVVVIFEIVERVRQCALGDLARIGAELTAAVFACYRVSDAFRNSVVRFISCRIHNFRSRQIPRAFIRLRLARLHRALIDGA